MNRVAATPLPDPPQQPTSFGTDSKGALYLVGYDGTVYRMLAGAPPSTSLKAQGHLAREGGRIFTVAPGGRLVADAFGHSPTLEIRTLSGSRIASVSRPAGGLPAGLSQGLYLLSSTGGARSDLLLVR
jgi:hypothetical protein